MVKVKEVKTGKIFEVDDHHYSNVLASTHNRAAWELVSSMPPEDVDDGEPDEDVVKEAPKKRAGRPKKIKQEE